MTDLDHGPANDTPTGTDAGTSASTDTGASAADTRDKARRVPRRKRVIEDWEGDFWDDPEITYVDTVEPLGRRRRLVPRLLALVSVLAIVAVLVAGVVAMWYIRQINPTGDPGPAVNFTVNDDDDLLSVSERLEADEFIVNADVFRWYVERQGGLELVPGFYTLRPRDHMGNILRVLQTPPNETYSKVTFPEGFTIEQMARRLADTMPGIDRRRFLDLALSGEIRSDYQKDGIDSLEGFLFPDTYFVAADETEAQILQRMVELMERVGRQEGLDGLDGNPDAAHDMLIIASMIEREAKVPGDRAKIARVIINRLILGMPLQIDATLYYGQDPDTSFVELRETPGPYNTYLNTGLPPTPIANPGRASIEAAMNPAPNPVQSSDLCRDLAPTEPCALLYYVLIDEDGSHAFAATFDQHLANIEIARAKGLL
jgi:UPF0755 protein